MPELLRFGAAPHFLPQGQCYLWSPTVVWLNVVADAAMAAAYFSIPLTFVYILRHRRDTTFRGMVLWFGAFIFACGTTHLLEIWTVWVPDYVVQGLFKLATAGLSVVAAVLLMRLTPGAVAIPSAAELAATARRFDEQAAERRRVEEALRRSEAYFRSMIENALDLITLVDATGVVLYASPSHARVLGYGSGELLGRDAFELIHPDDRGELRDIFARVVQQPGVPQAAEFRARHQDGSWRLLEGCANNRLEDATVAAIVVNSRDVTERHHAEATARARQAELARVLRVSTIGAMAAGLAHEINQPLSAIVSYARGAARRLQAGVAEPRELLDPLQEIASQALRADQIVRRVRDFVRKQEPHRLPVDLNALVRDAVELLRADARTRGVTVCLNLAADVPLVRGDGVQIEQVLLNLIRNGFEAMQRDGIAERTLCVATRRDDSGAVEVTVADTGDGLAADAVDQVFEPFYSTKAEGLGMGLAISRLIVEGHGGRLWATPATGRGATFHFSLPVSLNGDDDAA